MKVSDIYNKYKDVLILHCISKKGPESDIPKDIKFVDQIEYSIKISKSCKLSTCSFVLNKNTLSNLFQYIGVIIKDADIIGKFIEDKGLTYNTIHLINTLKEDNIYDVIFSPRTKYNEIILKNVELCGIFIYKENDSKILFSSEEITFASKKLNLPVYYLYDDKFQKANCLY